MFRLKMRRSVLVLMAIAGALIGAWELLVTRLCSVLFFWDLTYLALAMSLAAMALGATLAERAERSSWLGQRPLRYLTVAMPLLCTVAWLALTDGSWAWALGAFGWPFTLFGTASALAFRRATSGADRSWLYASELTGLMIGLLWLGPTVIASTPMPVFASIGVDTHLKELTRAEGLIHSEHVTTATVRTDLVKTRRESVVHVFTDGMFVARVVRWDGKSARFDDAHVEELATLKRLAQRITRPKSTLILGAGAGFDVAVALQEGAERVVAVEVNPATVAFSRRYDRWAGGIFSDRRVSVEVAEGRRFTHDHPGRWDVISLALMQTAPALGRGRTHVDGHLLTVEALQQYRSQLRDTGAIAVIQNTRSLASTTLSTMRHVAGPCRACAMAFRLKRPLTSEGARNPFAYLLVLKKNPLSSAESRRLDDVATKLGAQRWRPTDTGASIPTDNKPWMFLGTQQVPLHVPFALCLGSAALALALRRQHRRGRKIRWSVAGACAGAAGMSLQMLAVHCGQLVTSSALEAWTLALLVTLGGSAVGGLGSRWLERTERASMWAATAAIAGSVLALGLHDMWLVDFDASPYALALLGVAAMPAGLPFLVAVQRATASGSHEGDVLAADALGGIVGAALSLAVVIQFGFHGLWGVLPSLYLASAVAGRGR